MNITNNLKIIGSGKYLPQNKILSEDLEKQLGLPNGWAEKFSGVRERYHVTFETNAFLAVNALNMALENASLKIGNIDLLINASATFDYTLPYQAANVLSQFKKMDLNIATLNVNSSCLSFISALEIASSLLTTNTYKKIAIVSSEIASKGLNPDNKESMTLFGDGAAAVILEKGSTKTSGVVKSLQKTYSEGFEYSIIRGGGNKYFYKDFPYDPVLHSFFMEGKKLLRLAKRSIPHFFEELFDKENYSINDIDVIVPHQASKAGNAIFNKIYPSVVHKVYSNLENYGNCISASIPMCLHDTIEKGILKRGQSCLLAGTAAGFAIGGIILKY